MEQNIRTFKDFLAFYNLMSETCFKDCVNTFSRRELENDEISCVENCANKLIRFNNRSIGVYAKVQEKLMTKRIEEMEKQQSKIESENAAVPIVEDTTPTTEDS